MNKYAWECPFCQKSSTISETYDIDTISGWCELESRDGIKFAKLLFIVCPNPECKKLTLSLFLSPLKARTTNGRIAGKVEKSWGLIPDSKAKVYPEYIPSAIKEDYEEACRIKDLSPKASASLARRCLQGMIRDFWQIKKPLDYKGMWTLKNEIEAIKDKVEPDVWDAIDSVRKVGNVGAHMEEDVNLIVAVESDESQKLIELIEMLFDEWYINRDKRKQRLEELKKIAEDKLIAKQANQSQASVE